MLDVNKNTLTFIMAGGKGERLYPLTKYRTKPAVPFGGSYRVIDFTLSNCLNAGLRRIYVLTQYKSLSLDRHIQSGWNLFKREVGEFIEILPAQQRVGEDWYLGTADALYQNLFTIEMEGAQEVLILAGDHVYKMDYRPMLRYHREKKADLTIGAIPVPVEHAKELGIMELDSEGRVVSFQEKSERPKTIKDSPSFSLASMGIYVFRKKKLKEILLEDAKEAKSSHDFGKDIIPAMIGKDRVFAYPFTGKNKEPLYWRDIGSIDAYWEANMDLVSVSPIFNLYDQDWPIRTYLEQFPPAKTVFADGERKGLALDSLVSQGCIISGGLVERSILSPGVRVEEYAQVWESILMEGVKIGRKAKIRRAIIDKFTSIPEELAIGYNLEEDRKRFPVTEKGIVVVLQEAFK
ncbi:glucose-1-phosphate adenylyltransferase [bacterium]|nr:glucose-1-phosphate adenylyltransferase [bacterium]